MAAAIRASKGCDSPLPPAGNHSISIGTGRPEVRRFNRTPFADMFFDGGSIGVEIGHSGFMGSENLFLNCFWLSCRSLDGVFCEHVFEHFTQDDGERLARELKRCLRPTGTLRIIVPDAERVMRAYFEEPNWLAERRQAATAGEAINSYFRQRYDHHFLYDWPTMQRMLQRAGFATVVRSSYKVGQLSKGIVLDAPPYECESLYVEASPSTS